jgi:hypothetical protein
MAGGTGNAVAKEGTVKGFFYVIGILAVLLVLASTGAVQGDLCLGDVGCVHSDGAGISIRGDR